LWLFRRCGGDLDDLLGDGEVEPGVEIGLRVGGSVLWRKVPVGPVKVTAVEPVEVAAHVVPGLAGGVLDDADEQQRDPAQQMWARMRSLRR
jgi:hypothetical protein